MRVLFDTNIILDALLEREPHSSDALDLMAHVEQGRLMGLLGATTITTIYYVAARAIGPHRTRYELQKLLTLFEIAFVGRAVISDAFALDFTDYEDAVIHETARHADASGIVTRDGTGFVNATIRTYSPDELLVVLDTIEKS